MELRNRETSCGCRLLVGACWKTNDLAGQNCLAHFPPMNQRRLGAQTFLSVRFSTGCCVASPDGATIFMMG